MLIKKSRVFFHYFISYLIILLIPILIGSIAYMQALSVVEKDAKEINAVILQQGSDTIDRYFAEIENVVKQMALNIGVAQLLHVNSPVNEIDIYDVFKTRQDISSYTIPNNFIYSYYIYFKNSGVILAQNASYTNPELFYNDYLKSNEIDYDYWINNLMTAYHYQDFIGATAFNTNGMKKSFITYMQSIPMAAGTNPKGCISVLIDESEIKKLLKQIYIKRGGWFYITDRNDNIISSTAENPKEIQTLDIDFTDMSGTKDMTIKNEKMFVSYIISEKNGWKYVAVIPYHIIMAKVGYIKNITLIITLIILIAGLIIAFIIAYQNIKPVNRLVKTVINKFGKENEISGRNEYDFIEGAFTRLIDNNEYLQHTMKEQIPLIRVTFFERLIKGEFTNLKEVESGLVLLDMRVKGELYTVLVLQLKSYFETYEIEVLKELEKKRVITKGIISSIAEDNIYLHDVENDKIMLMITSERKTTEEVNNEIEVLIEKINSTLNSLGHSSFYFGIGYTYESLLNIYKSYNEARQALEYSSIKNESNIVWYYKIIKKGSSYYFPLEVQTRIFNLVKAGQNDELEKLLDEIYIENYQNRDLSAEMIKQVLYEMRGIVVKLKEIISHGDKKLQMEIDKNKKMIEEIKPINNGYTYLASLLKMLCITVENQKRSHNTLLGMKIIDYINSNYIDSQLSLSSIASQFNLNEAYLSFFFKEHSGENFSAYLENIRIKKACELLDSNNMQVNEVAAKVGYNSDQSFRRAFKRIMFISPTDYIKETLNKK